MNTVTTLTNLADTKRKVDSLLELSKITLEDIEHLDKLERKYLGETAAERLHRLTGEERDQFISKIEQVIQPITKSQIWEYNHDVISRAVTRLMRTYGMMPSKSDIAKETGLSRQTVVKHMKEYKTHPEYLAEIEQFKFMAPHLLATVFKVASHGDMKAARLYFEMVGAISKPQLNTVVNKQNNYIQINNTILSQENLSNLTADQLNQIENIVTTNAGSPS